MLGLMVVIGPMVGNNCCLGTSGLPTQGASLIPEGGDEGLAAELQWFPEDTTFPGASQPHIAHPGQFCTSMLHLLCFLPSVFLALSPLQRWKGKEGVAAEPGSRREGREDVL